ncbi:hypothetical protein H5185_02550 [Shewanella sp. SG44-6]|uniref:hypothetical protein n=1 Tax=Shewanella sp. SG44-6 TaxID=2760959 RepID=UPI0015FFA7A5|nr:hypothetical protein [Shewanella sp. SG44-6]MBB1388302.1 hypothetical protein [Shewanella sp. SG44-6]
MFDTMVLNEASLPFRSKDECENKIDSFFELLHEAKLHNIKFSRADDIEGDWNQLNYADDFIFGQWLNNIADKERQRQVKSVLSNMKCPLVDVNNNQQGVNAEHILFTLHGLQDVEVLGLGFASLNNSHGLSFASAVHWEQDSISIEKLWMHEGVEQSETVNVPNVSSIVQLRPILANFEARRMENKAYFDALNVSDNDDFENLLFTESVLKSLRSTSLHPLDFRRVIEVLKKLNEGIIDAKNLLELSTNSGLDISGESERTMQNRSLVRLRTFEHPSLKRQIFDVHVKNFNNFKRMHILVDYKLKTVCIGYFGKHLKTATE